MAEKLDYAQMAKDIVNLVGGVENIDSLAHCMTRLRFILKDESLAKTDDIKAIKGVLGIAKSGGQYMVILGKNLMDVYDQIHKQFNISEGENSTENLDKEPLTVKSALLGVLSYVQASVTPLITGLVAGGMGKVVLLLIGLVNPAFNGTTTYKILTAVADAPFFFMPIFVAYGAARKLGGTPIYAMAVAAALLHGGYTSLIGQGPATLIGIPVRLISYSSSLLPALLIALAAYHAERLFNKIIPGIFKSLLVGLGTMAVTGIFAFTILGPIGNIVGGYLAYVFIFLGDKIGFIAIGVLAACLPWLIMAGMHMALPPFMVQALSNPGYDSLLRPAFLLHNMCEGGACIGVALRAKTAAERSEALGLAFGCIVAGVTEPAIYGINLPKKSPMIGVMAGGMVGGIVAGLLHVRNYVMGYSTILALPIFQDTMIKMLIAIIIGIATAAIVTFVLLSPARVAAAEAKAKAGKKK